MKGPKDYEIKEVAPKIYVIQEYNLSTMTVVVGTKRALVIDLGDGVDDFRSVVEKLCGGLPYDVTLTHGHVDHSGGRWQFPKIHMSPKDKRPYKDSTPLLRKLYLVGMKFTVPTIPFKKARFGRRPQPEIEYIDEGHVFDLGGRTVKAVALPGHTVGSLGYLVREDRILIGGDSLNPGLFLFMHHSASVESWLKTARKVVSIHDRFDFFFPSHGFSPLSEESLQDLITCAENILKKRKKNFFLPLIVKERYRGTSITYRLSHVRDKKFDRRFLP